MSTNANIKRRLNDQDIIKSPGDDRLYRALELNNGMRVLLVSDAQTDKSAAAMDVYIGRDILFEKLPYCLFIDMDASNSKMIR